MQIVSKGDNLYKIPHPIFWNNKKNQNVICWNFYPTCKALKPNSILQQITYKKLQNSNTEHKTEKPNWLSIVILQEPFGHKLPNVGSSANNFRYKIIFLIISYKTIFFFFI